MAVWSPRDEQDFQEKLARRTLVRERQLHDLGSAVARMKLGPIIYTAETEGVKPPAPGEPGPLLQAFIDNAEALRDALAPFDSGVRPGDEGVSPDA